MHRPAEQMTPEDRAPAEIPEDDRDRKAILAALRVARARAKLVVHTIDEIGFDLKQGYLTPLEAMRECINARIDGLFPRESDGG
jgi:hypothetical protein